MPQTIGPDDRQLSVLEQAKVETLGGLAYDEVQAAAEQISADPMLAVLGQLSAASCTFLNYINISDDGVRRGLTHREIFLANAASVFDDMELRYNQAEAEQAKQEGTLS